MAKLTLPETFTLSEIIDWVKENNPDTIECTPVQFQCYYDMLQPQERILRLHGKNVQISQEYVVYS